MPVRKTLKKWKAAHESFERKANVQRLRKIRKVTSAVKRISKKYFR